MKVYERAAQIWPILICAARNRQLPTYTMVGDQIDVVPINVGKFLIPIQSYCLSNGLPALTVLVVNKSSGLPGVGFIAAADIPQEQQKVFLKNWLEEHTPSPEEFEKAVKGLPS